jgi:hypothetical protein
MAEVFRSRFRHLSRHRLTARLFGQSAVIPHARTDIPAVLKQRLDVSGYITERPCLANRIRCSLLRLLMTKDSHEAMSPRMLLQYLWE